MMKTCTKCSLEKENLEFNRSSAQSDGFYPICRDCHRQSAKDWYYNNRERQLALRKVYQESRKETIGHQKALRREKCRLDVIRHFSFGTMACACCGENNLKFLTVDHVNNDGSKHRRELFGRQHGYSSGDQFFSKLAKDGYQTQYCLQILCMNCNHGKRMNKGICPHHQSSEGSTTIPKGSTLEANANGSARHPKMGLPQKWIKPAYSWVMI